LSAYLDAYYADAKADLFSTFITLSLEKLVEKGRSGLITMESWMFLSSFDKLRKNILENYYISSLGHFGWYIIGIAFGTVMSIIENAKPKNRTGVFSYLTIEDINNDTGAPYNYPKKDNGRYAKKSQKNFLNIPGYPIGYWVSETILNHFGKKSVDDYGSTNNGFTTGDNNQFLRLWNEVSYRKCSFSSKSIADSVSSSKKWFAYNKGGAFRKWYGNNEYLINWEDNGDAVKSFGHLVGRSMNYQFKSSISWSKITAGAPSFKFKPEGTMFDVAGLSLFPYDNEDYGFLLGLCNSIFSRKCLEFLSPTLNYETGHISSIPVVKKNEQVINSLVQCNISISKQDWDAHETSWDFEENELIALQKEGLGTITAGFGDTTVMKYSELELLYMEYEAKWRDKFMQLHANEEELNRQFIEIYGLQDELTPDVPLDEITILQQGEIKIENGEVVFQRDEVMRQFMSYLVGLIMGRYRLDKKGLNIAHPEATDEELASYTYRNGIVEIDGDGILPLMGGDCSFVDNALKRLSELVRVIFGDESHARNMAFINDCLGKSLEDYLTKDFYADHLKRYQKRPIYWLFSSKKGAFKVLAYMHRMDRYTAEMIRNKYLLPHIESQRVAIADLEQRMAVLTTAERKKLEKLRKEHEECIEYHERLHAKADEQIGFDLDDGVVMNYAKFGDVLAKLK
jgi:hypothetical protein